MNRTLIAAALLMSLISTAQADQKQLFTYPIKFTVVNPCNGDNVKVVGKLKETINLDKTNTANFQHDTSGVTAQGVSGAKYTMQFSSAVSNITFTAKDAPVKQSDLGIKMISDKPDIVPDFFIKQDMSYTFSSNGSISVAMSNLVPSCKPK